MDPLSSSRNAYPIWMLAIKLPHLTLLTTDWNRSMEVRLKDQLAAGVVDI